MPVKIRRLKLEDYLTVKDLERVTLNEYRRELKRTRQIDTIGPTVSRSLLAYYSRTGLSFVAESDGKVVGFLLCQPMPHGWDDSKSLWLEFIAVSRTYRRTGIGGMLLAQAFKAGRSHRYEQLCATLNPNNIPSRRLLESQGFSVKDWLTATKRTGF